MLRPGPAFSLLVTFTPAGDDASEACEALRAAGSHVYERTAADGFSRQWIVETRGEHELSEAEDLLRAHLGNHLRTCIDRTLGAHADGTLTTRPNRIIHSYDDLALVSAPGAGRVARLIHRDPSRAEHLSGSGSTIAVVSDGTGLRGLGDLGPHSALPFVEGTAALYMSLTGLKAVPLVIDTRSVEAFATTIAAIAPNFVAVHLEGIAAPRCFIVEDALVERAGIPVLHAEQHATAITVLAALRNALDLVGKRLDQIRIVLAGADAAATATAHLLVAAGAQDLVVVDRDHVLREEDSDRIAFHQAELAHVTNPRDRRGNLGDLIPGADVYLGLAGPKTMNPDLVALMAIDPIVFALGIPQPEFNPKRIAATAAIVATGSTSYPNPIHKALVYPGLMRGMIEAHLARPGTKQSLAAAAALAQYGGVTPTRVRLLPDLFDPGVPTAIAHAVVAASSEPEPSAQRVVAPSLVRAAR